MGLPPRHFVQLCDRRYRGPDGNHIDYGVVAFLPLEIGRYMPTLATEVRLGQEYARKIVTKHNLIWEDLSAIQDLIYDSFCIQEKIRHLLFIGFSESRQKLFNLVLKSARYDSETWVATLHRTEELQLRARVRRAREAGRLIRTWKQPFDE